MSEKWRSIHDWSMSHGWRFLGACGRDLSSMNDSLISSSIGKRDRKKLISSSNSDFGREISRRYSFRSMDFSIRFLLIYEGLRGSLIVFSKNDIIQIHQFYFPKVLKRKSANSKGGYSNCDLIYSSEGIIPISLIWFHIIATGLFVR